MKTYEPVEGLLVEKGSNRCAGYIFDFAEHGAFGPSKVEPQPSKEQIAAHNAILAKAERDAMCCHGTAILYVHRADATKVANIGTWEGSQWWPIEYSKTSFHNMAGRDGRRDYWFTGPDGKHWHGVNIGDNDIVRCKRIKS